MPGARMVLLGALFTAICACKEKLAADPQVIAAQPAEGAALTGDALPEPIANTAPSKVASDVSVFYQEPGACGWLDIQLQDANSLIVPAASRVTLALSSSAKSAVFYSDDACTKPINSLEINSGSFDAIAYYRDQEAGSATLTVSDMMAHGLTSLTMQAHATPVTQVGLAGLVAAQSAADCNLLTIEPQDGGGHAVALARSVSFKLQASSGSAGFYSDGACSMPIKSAVVAAGAAVSDLIYFKDPSAGKTAITVSESPSLGWNKATAVIAIGD